MSQGVSAYPGAKKRGRSLFSLRQDVLHVFDRVALARAVYARTKYVLLDDPLSAVVSCKCAHGRRIFFNVSQGLAHRATLVRETTVWTFVCQSDRRSYFLPSSH